MGLEDVNVNLATEKANAPVQRPGLSGAGGLVQRAKREAGLQRPNPRWDSQPTGVLVES